MRSSKNRSRSKGNRNRSVGNIINRVFDSSGPEGKVRGTPQQIIDKYQQLARDAQLSNDRVAAENFLQHAEHYTRLLGEAQRELEMRRDEQGGARDYGQQGQRRDEGDGGVVYDGTEDQPDIDADYGEARQGEDTAPRDLLDLAGGSAQAQSDLVPTPEAEAASRNPRRGRGPRKPRPPMSDGGDDAKPADPQEAAE